MLQRHWQAWQAAPAGTCLNAQLLRKSGGPHSHLLRGSTQLLVQWMLQSLHAHSDSLRVATAMSAALLTLRCQQKWQKQ